MVGVLVAGRGAVVAAVVAVALFLFIEVKESARFLRGEIGESRMGLWFGLGLGGVDRSYLRACMPYLGVGAAAGDGVAAVAVGGLGRHFCLGCG
jgi:hypothetical protein